MKSNEIKEKEEYEKYARDHRKRLDAQEVKLGDVVKVLVGHFAGETGVIVGISACDKHDYSDPYYEIGLECEVPEKYLCRKSLVEANKVTGGWSRRDFKVIGNRAPIQPTDEIKVGDTVRLSNGGPRFYRRCDSIMIFEYTYRVVDIWEDIALLDSTSTKFQTMLPTKYLVKVGAEKEAKPKFKKDDKVCINASSLKHGLRGEILTIIGVDVSDRTYWVQSSCMRSPIWLREDEISLYTEPTEQTEAEKKPNVGSIKIPVEVDLTDSYWDAYAADLAKEIVLKTVNSASDRRPMAIAEYATDVAKSVVEGLKRK